MSAASFIGTIQKAEGIPGLQTTYIDSRLTRVEFRNTRIRIGKGIDTRLPDGRWLENHGWDWDSRVLKFVEREIQKATRKRTFANG